MHDIVASIVFKNYISVTAITFKVNVVGGVFKGTLNEETTVMEGTWTQGGARIPLQLKRSR